MQRLKFLFQNTRQEFHRAPVQWVAAVCVIIVTIIPVGASLMDYKFASSNPVNKLLQVTIEGNLPLILMSTIFLVWSLLLLIKPSNSKTEYFTIGKFKWKTDIFKNNDFEVHQIPYCLEHGTKLVYAETHYACPAIQLGCESMIEKDKLITNHEAAKSFIEYKINKKSGYSLDSTTPYMLWPD